MRAAMVMNGYRSHKVRVLVVRRGAIKNRTLKTSSVARLTGPSSVAVSFLLSSIALYRSSCTLANVSGFNLLSSAIRAVAELAKEEVCLDDMTRCTGSVTSDV